MVMLYIALFIVSILAIQARYRTLFVPATIIAVTWCIFPAIASLGVLGIYEISFKTHLYIIISFLSYMVVTLMLHKVRFVGGHLSLKGNAKPTNGQYEANYKFLLIGNIVVAIWLTTRMDYALSIIAESGFVHLRNVYESILSESTIVNIIYNWFAKPFVAASCAIFCIDILQARRKQQVWLGIVILVNIALDTLVFAARATIVKMIIYFFFAFFFCRTQRMSKKQVAVVILIVVLLLSLVAFMTGERMSESYSDFSFLDSIFMYYVAPFGLLDHYVTHPEFSMLGSDMLYGSAMLGAIYNIFRSALFILWGTEYNGSDYIIQLVTQKTVRVGTDVSINSACTAAYIFLRDWGGLGLIIGFALMALLTEVCRKAYLKNHNVRYSAIYVVMLYTVFRLSMSYDFLTPATLFSIVFIFLVTKKRRIDSQT